MLSIEVVTEILQTKLPQSEYTVTIDKSRGRPVPPVFLKGLDWILSDCVQHGPKTVRVFGLLKVSPLSWLSSEFLLP